MHKDSRCECTQRSEALRPSLYQGGIPHNRQEALDNMTLSLWSDRIWGLEQHTLAPHTVVPKSKLLFRYMRSTVLREYNRPVGDKGRVSSKEVLLFWEKRHFHEIQHWPEPTDWAESCVYWSLPRGNGRTSRNHRRHIPPLLLGFLVRECGGRFEVFCTMFIEGFLK